MLPSKIASYATHQTGLLLKEGKSYFFATYLYFYWELVEEANSIVDPKDQIVEEKQAVNDRNAKE